jgi:hypothetical protein
MEQRSRASSPCGRGLRIGRAVLMWARGSRLALAKGLPISSVQIQVFGTAHLVRWSRAPCAP